MRKHQHRKWSLSQRVNKSTEVHVSPGEFDVVEDSRISKPPWMGLKASVDLRIPIQDSILKPNTESAALLFKDITLVPYVAWVFCFGSYPKSSPLLEPSAT